MQREEHAIVKRSQNERCNYDDIDVSAEEQKPSTNRQVFQGYGYDRQNKNKRENQSLRIVKWWHHSCGPSRHQVQMTLTVGTPKAKVNIGAR